MDWIKLAKRMAIYARDAFDCVYCQSVFPPDPLGYGLSLDHLRGRRDHRASNLVTACIDCNTRRGRTPLRDWVAELEAGGQVGVMARIHAQTAKPLDVVAGRALALQRRPKLDPHGNRARARLRAQRRQARPAPKPKASALPA